MITFPPMEDIFEEGLDLVEDALGVHRRVWEDERHTHAQIEVRGIEDPSAVGFRQRIALALSRLDAVRWAEVNALTGRVAVAFDGGEPTLELLIEMFDRLEAAQGPRREAIPPDWDASDRAEHPADVEPVHRVIALIVGDVLSLGWSVAGRAAHLARVPVELTGIVSVIENNPWLRLQAERIIGRRAAALVLPLASSASSGFAQGPFGVLVDLGLQTISLGEVRARKRAWDRREPEFYAEHDDDTIEPPDLPPRPIPLPDGPIEVWARRAARGSLVGSLGMLAVTRDPRRAMDVMLVGAPRAGRLGREAFAAHLGRSLADRGIVPLDAAALRRLDRVDTVVITEDVLLHPRTGELDAGAEHVIDAARRCGHRLLVAGDEQAGALAAADGTLRTGRALGDDIRSLQAEGAVVALVGRHEHHGLAAADVGIGTVTASGRPSWGADLLLGREPADAVPLIEATTAAAEVSRRATTLTQAGAAAGALTAFTGRKSPTISRGLAMVYGAAGAALVDGAWSAAQIAHQPRPRVADRTAWHALPADEAVELLDSDPDAGLTVGQVAKRRSITHHATADVSLLDPFLAELANPLNPVLGVGAALSATTGSMVDAGLVLGLIGVNTAVGGLQRLRADAVVRDLLRTEPEMVTAVRDGREVEVAGDRLVPGDVIVLRAGDAIPADARVLAVDSCEVDESSLTGESLPVAKRVEPAPEAAVADRDCMLFADTTVAGGSVRAVVVAVGEYTEVARSLALAGRPPPSGVEVRLEHLTRQLLPAALTASAATAGVGLLRRWPVPDVVATTVSLAIASVPEGLPFVATAGQLAGARRLAAHGAVVRNPRTVEALGRVDVVCVDKTGTLTEGRVAVTAVSDGREVWPVDSGDPQVLRIVTTALRASEHPDRNGRSVEQLDDTDRAIHRAAAELGLDPDPTDGWAPIEELPFEAARGLHAALGRTDVGVRIVVKGAPEVVLARSRRWRLDGTETELDEHAARRVSAQVSDLARHGHRLLAVAEGVASDADTITEDDLEDLCLHGLVVLADPVRATAAAAIRGIGEAGVRTVMVTGDHPDTAASVAAELGLTDDDRWVVVGSELDELDDAELAATLERTAVIARVTPAHKLRIVGALQASGRTVAMTGDGANDAAAIRLADVGVALGLRASPAARDAADIVVTDDRIETLIDAIAEGRALWGSIREALAVLVGGNLGEIAFTGIASLFSRRAPLHPRQFLIVNMFTDLAPAVAIAVRPPEVSTETLLREGPEASLGAALRRDVAIRGTATALGASAAWGAARMTGSSKRASTVGLVALVGTQLGQTVVAGGWRRPATLLTAAGSAAALVAIVQTPGVSRFFGSRPLGPVGWAQATTAAGVATLGSSVASRIAERVDRQRSWPELERDRNAPLVGRSSRASMGQQGRAEDGTLDVVVAGASGFIGRALVPRLLDAGHRVRCLVRDEERLPETWRSRVQVVTGRVEHAQSVLRAADGAAAAYYLVQDPHGPGDGIVEQERAAARAFRDGVEAAGVGRIVHLGRLIADEDLAIAPDRLYARRQAAEELRAGTVPTTEIRAAMVLGDDGPWNALLRTIARSPVALRPRWSDAEVQPVVLEDAVALLLAVLDDPRAAWQILEAGGPEVVSYAELIERTRTRIGRRRARALRIPFLPPETSAAAAAVAAGVDPARALALFQTARIDAVVHDDHTSTLYPGSLTTPLDEGLTGWTG